jgi:hypothetical protein
MPGVEKRREDGTTRTGVAATVERIEFIRAEAISSRTLV